MTENERLLLMLLQMLDSPQAYNQFVSAFAQPAASNDSMDVRRLSAMGGDASRAYQDFMAAINAGKSYEQAKASFEEEVKAGQYVLDMDTADMITKTALDSIANTQSGGGSDSIVELFKDMGAPELATLAPAAVKGTPRMQNPYAGLAPAVKQVSRQYQVAPKDIDTRIDAFRDVIPDRTSTTWNSREAMLDYMKKISENPQVQTELVAMEGAQGAQQRRGEDRNTYRQAFNKAYKEAGGGPRLGDYDVARAQLLSILLGR